MAYNWWNSWHDVLLCKNARGNGRPLHIDHWPALFTTTLVARIPAVAMGLWYTCEDGWSGTGQGSASQSAIASNFAIALRFQCNAMQSQSRSEKLCNAMQFSERLRAIASHFSPILRKIQIYFYGNSIRYDKRRFECQLSKQLLGL